MKGTILSRKEKRKLERTQKKRNKLLFSNKKKKFKRNDNTNEEMPLKIHKNVNNHEKGKQMRDTKNDSIEKSSIKGNKKKRNSYSNDLSDAFQKKKAKKMNRSIRDLDEDQKKDEYLLSYLSKKLKINNNKHNEEKLFNELTKDGFDSNLLKLTDIIFDDFQKKRSNKKGNKKLKNRKEAKEEEEDEEEEDENEEEEDEEEDENEEEEDEEEEEEDGEEEIDEDEEDEEEDEEEEEEDDEGEDEEEGEGEEDEVDEEEEIDEDEEDEEEVDEEDDEEEDEEEVDEEDEEDEEEEIDEYEVGEAKKTQTKGIAKKENYTKKRQVNYKEEEKKIEKFLMLSLNKTSEFNIKCIIEDICKYFHDIKDSNLKLTFVNSLVKIISNNFKNANITDTHIYIFVVMVCVLNNLTYRKLLKDFLKELVIIFKTYFKNNINLMKRVERENEIININLIKNEENGKKNNTMIKITTNTENEEINDAYDNNNNVEGPNKFEKQSLEDKSISQSEYDKYQDFKIILRNLLKCFSLFYALNYVDFDFITDIINVLCEYISINSVDNIIIILKICGLKLKNDDVSHLNYITDHLKKEVDNYILKNNIYLEKSKLRFLIKDIEDLKNGKMKFYFLNRFEFLSNILNEFEKKYEFKKDIVSFSFQNMFKKDDKTKRKTNELNMTTEGENESDDTNANGEKNKSYKNNNSNKYEKKNMKENNFNKLNYLVGEEETNSNELHYNKMLKKYKIQGILSKKIFLIVKNSLDIEECVHNLSVILKNEKNIPHVIQTIIQIILYDKKYKVAYCRILSNISKFKNRVFLFSLKTIVINFIKNINNYDLKKILFLSKLFIFLLKENLINFKIFKFINIDENDDQTEQKNNSTAFNLHFFFKTIFILISIDEKSTDPSKNAQLWENISQVLHNGQISSSYFYSFKKIIKKYIFDEEENIKCVYPHFNMKYIQCFHKFLEKKTKRNI
ncbi:hypothetical protein YYC_02966 [Plasmodium yoelii 17X]|uniref:MI domain-containing protein n=1 Tax=Plasmodium yoelii 17X TaxID=1323249 RepID=V7PMC4_PLAYE|nr:hypothetical protein YYC_02966 [Plasmodium yoelii 17X]